MGSTLAITPAALTATVADQTKIYGDDDPALAGIGVTLTGLVNDPAIATWNGAVAVNDSALASTVTSLTRDAGETVAGSLYAITAGTFTTPSTNYSAPSLALGSTLAITPAALTATVADQTKIYGDDDPALAGIGVTLTGLVNDPAIATWNGAVAVNDSALATTATSLTRDAGETVAGSLYAITAGTFTTPSTNYSAPSLALGSTLDITPASLTATVADQTKIYGTDDPALAGIGVTLTGLVNDPAITTWNGAVAVDDSALASTVTSLTRDAGETVAGSLYAITAGTFTTPSTNYSSPSLVLGSTLDITPKTVNLAATRNYDGTTDFAEGTFTPTITGTVANTSWIDWNGNITTVLGAQTLSIASSGTGTVPSRNAGPAQTMTTGTIALADGSNGGLATNYTLTGGTHNGTITPKALTAVDLTGTVTKVYDGDATVDNLTTGNYSITGFVAGEGATIGVETGTYVAGKDVIDNPAGSAVTSAVLAAADYTATGTTLLSNYDLTAVMGVSATGAIGEITAADLALSGTRVYDATTVFAGDNLIANGIAGETFTVIGAGDITNLASKHVQTGSTLASVTGLSLGTSGDGGLASNYKPITTTGSSVDVTARPVTLTAPSVTKTYDGLLIYATTAGDLNAITLSGPLAGTDTVSAATITYTDKNAGTNNKTVNLNAATIDDGNSGANYTVTLAGNTTSTITALGITGSITAADKVYDGNNLATITGRSLTGALGTDDVTYTGGTATFSDKNVAAGKTVTGTGLSLTGADAGNYTVNTTTTTLADITPAPLGIAANSTSKIYGDTVSFTGTEFGSSGLKNGETVGSVSLASAGAAATAGVAGSPYDITASAATGGTFDPGNYTISYFDGALGVIPAPLGIAANSATRLYGDANPAFSATYTGFQNGETTDALTGALALTTPAVAISNVGSYAIIPSGQSSTNYTISYVNGKLSVTPAPLGIAANSTSKIYGDTVSFTGAEFSSTGLKNGETIGNVSLASAGATATAGVAGSPYDITASAAAGGTFDASNYTISYVEGALGVIPAPLGIAANSTSKIYGETVSFIGAEFSSTGLKNSETIGSVSLASAGAAADADVVGSPYDITASAAAGGTFDAGNYTISYVDGSLGVIPAGLLGIAANAAAKTYDGLAYSGGNGVNYTGFQAGDTPDSLDGTLEYGGSSQGAVNVGTYSIIPFGQSSPNYEIVYVNGKLSVIPAPLGIAANSATRLYGEANPAFSATYTGFQNGETPSTALTGALMFATPAIPASNVDNYAITPSGQSSTNYTISYVDGTLGVTPAPLGIAANSISKTYGSTVSFTGAEFSSTGLKNGETVGSVNLASAGTAPTAGVAGSPYDITASSATGGTFNAANYTISYVDGALGVTPAALGIAANSATRLYGEANPAFSATYTGFQNGETPSTALTGALMFATPAIPASNVGNYAIAPSGQSSTNYTISYVDGILGVTPVPLIVTADAQSKVYGTSDPALTFGATGLVNNPALGVVDTVGNVFSGALTRTGGETLLGGPYAITRGTLAPNSNYTLASYTGNNLTITPAALTVAANPQSKVYGTSDPALTYSVAGLVNNPALGVADTADSVLSGALTRATGDPDHCICIACLNGETVTGGPYAIAQGTLAANSNYTLGFTGSDLTITPAALDVAANPQSKVFGTSDPALTYSVAGIVNNPALGIADTADSVLSGALTRVPGESALGGPYAITQGTLAAKCNYTLGFTPNDLIIIGAAAEPVLGFNAGQVIFAGVINNEFYYRPGNFWHISLNPNNADPGFDVMRGTNDLNSRLRRSMNPCDSISGGGFCETWSFPQQFEKVDEK
ncbi:MAG: hypothetical protein K9K88_06700 [Desulfobacterales bacterium]|nr:hypothetical protein [Desulfobacterales bacterium]